MHWIAKHRHQGGWLAYAQVFVAAVSLSVAAYFLDRNYEDAHGLDLRLNTSTALALEVETLQNRIQFEFASVEAIQKQLSRNPDLGADAFNMLAKAMMENNPDLLSISAKGSSGQILTYQRGDTQPAAIDIRTAPHARDDYIVGMPDRYERASFGPVVRMQTGEYALPITIPVFTHRDGTVIHWGTVTSFIDAAKFFRKTGLTQPHTGHRLDVRIAGHADDALEPFFKADQVASAFGSDAVKTSLNVLSDTWQFAAMPYGGWSRSPSQLWGTRSIFLAIGIIVLLPFFRSLRLLKLNEENQMALAKREVLLQQLTNRLDLALGSYQCGVWEAAADGDYLYWDERMRDLHGAGGRSDWPSRENWLKLVHPEDRDYVNAYLPQIGLKAGRQPLTVKITRLDGEVRSIRYVGQLHAGPNGDQRLYGIAVDVTDDVMLAEELRLAKQETEGKNRELETALLQLSRNERELRVASERLNLAVKAYGCGVWECDLEGLVHDWDARMHELYNIPMTDGVISRETWLSRIHPDDVQHVMTKRHEAIAHDGHYSSTYRIMPTPDTTRHLRVFGFVHGVTGDNRKFIGLAIDVTEDVELQKALQEATRETEKKNRELETALLRLSGREADLQELTQRFQLAIQAYGCGIWEANLGTGTAVWDRRMHEYFDIPYVDGEVDGDIFLKRIHPDDLLRVQASIAEATENGAHYSCTYRVLPESGGIRHLQAMGQTHLSADGSLKFIGIALDISEQYQKNEALIAAKNDAEAKRAELEAMHAMLQHTAMHDPLTGLHNRRALDEALERLAGEPRDPLKRVTLLHIDLDRFKQINDTLGHAAGDAMLVHAADVLRKNTRKHDLVARIGGDEFVVLVQNGASNQEISALAARIIERMNIPLQYEGQECRFGVSIGIAREQTRRSSVRQLLVNADIALYRAKAHGRNRFEFFTSNLQAEIRRNKTLADEILRGLENREFVSWYQPQFCARTHALTGVEALVRWNHPQRGLLTPDKFIRNAEEINALATIDAHVLEQALTDRLSWAARGLMVPKISVNVSARRLRDDQLIKSLKDLAISPGQIAFELVESIYLDDDDDAITRNIRRLKSLGIDIEIDDFGTGHTSIVSLLKLEPKRLKIDRQLVQPMLTSSREFSLVRSIIEIGSSLDIETVAEGVETMTHAARLEELGCSTLQGYAFAKPTPAPDLVDLIVTSPWKTFREVPFVAGAI